MYIPNTSVFISIMYNNKTVNSYDHLITQNGVSIGDNDVMNTQEV